MQISRFEVLAHMGYSRDPFRAVKMETADGLRVGRLLQMAVSGGAMVSIVGERGIGKSVSVDAALKRIKAETVMVQTSDKKRLSIGDIEQAMILDLSDEIPKRTKEVRIRQLRRILGEASAKRPVVVLLEEAHRMHPSTLRALKTLRELEWMGRRELFSAVLVGQSDPMGRSGVSEVRLRSDCVRMAGLTREEAREYVNRAAGKSFSPAALDALAGAGITNFLDLQAAAVRAMASAMAAGRRQVEAEDLAESPAPAYQGPAKRSGAADSAALKRVMERRRQSESGESDVHDTGSGGPDAAPRQAQAAV